MEQPTVNRQTSTQTFGGSIPSFPEWGSGEIGRHICSVTSKLTQAKSLKIKA